MKNVLKLALVSLLALSVLSACDKTSQEAKQENNLLGAWQFKSDNGAISELVLKENNRAVFGFKKSTKKVGECSYTFEYEGSYNFDPKINKLSFVDDFKFVRHKKRKTYDPSTGKSTYDCNAQNSDAKLSALFEGSTKTEYDVVEQDGKQSITFEKLLQCGKNPTFVKQTN